MSPARRIGFLLVFGLGGVALLVSLGVWQLQRLEWKRGLIARIEARAAAPALEATGRETREPFDHRAAIALGAYPEDAPQIRYLTSLKGLGPGFRLIAPFELRDGTRILIDRGFAPEAAAPRGGAAPAPPTGEQRIEGRLRWPNERSAFSPEPNREQMLWFAREVESMADALGTEPVLLVQEFRGQEFQGQESRGEEGAGAWPKPLPSAVSLPDNHLGYAITWFSLAVIWLVMTALFGFRRRG